MLQKSDELVSKRDDDVKDVYTVIYWEKTYVEEEIKNLGTTCLVEAEKKLKRDAEWRWTRRSSGRDRRPMQRRAGGRQIRL